jgi:plastocyanin
LRKTLVSAMATTALLSLTLALPASADSQPEVRVNDECDPVTFNQVLGPGACNPSLAGNVTFQQLFGQLGQRPADVLRHRDASGWKYSPDEASYKPGTRLLVKNTGGEFHTFTNVTASGFTGGCVAELNAPLGLSPNPQCASFPQVIPGALPSGAQLEVSLSSTGQTLYQCLIHPWMRATINVSR